MVHYYLLSNGGVCFLYINIRNTLTLNREKAGINITGHRYTNTHIYLKIHLNLIENYNNINNNINRKEKQK